MSEIFALNRFVFFDDIEEARKIGGMEAISQKDEDFRTANGIVVSAAEGVPLKPGDKFIFNRRNAYSVYAGDKMHRFVRDIDIIAKVL